MNTRIDCSKYFLKMYLDSVATESGGDSTFSLSGRLRKRGRRPKPGEPLRADDDPVVLQCAVPLLTAFAERALIGGYQIRVDVSKAEARENPWPRWCTSLPQFAGLLESLVPRPENQDHIKIYPISIWFLPCGSSTAESVVEAFRALPMDDGMFSDVLRAGVFRIALFDAFFDILAEPALAGPITEWMRAATQGASGIRSEWDIEVSD